MLLQTMVYGGASHFLLHYFNNRKQQNEKKEKKNEKGTKQAKALKKHANRSATMSESTDIKL